MSETGQRGNKGMYLELKSENIEDVFTAIGSHRKPNQTMQMTLKDYGRGMILVLTDAEEPPTT